MAKFKKGDLVVQVVTPIQGIVSGFSVDQETGDTQVKIEWQDEHGNHSRYFKDAELEATPIVNPV
jgi:hypothetical protein